MRGWSLLPLVGLLAACGSSKEEAPPPEAPPVRIEAGQWTFSRTTTGYNTPTVTAEEYAAKVGQKSEDDICLKVGDDGRPDADALAGKEGSDCTYKEGFLHNGRLVATLACKAGEGTSELSVEGNYTADSMTLGVSMTKSVDGKPVLRTTHDLTGKRTGDCKSEG